MHFAIPRISSHNALKKAVPTLWHLLRLFVSPLQRGGTCAAHPPPPEGMPCVPDIKHFTSKCLPLKPASRIRLQIPSSKAFPHPFVPSPGPAHTAALRPQFALEASKCDFLAFQKSSYFLPPFFLEKMRKSRILTSQNHSQTLPKRLQNRCSKKHRFFRGFLLQFLYICYLGNLENINFP